MIPGQSRMVNDALFSPCRRYRYALWRRWNDRPADLVFIGLNPSTADETQDDATVKRCVQFARVWGYGGLCVANLFAFCARDPKEMMAAADPIGPDNDAWLLKLSGQASLVIAAWGNHGAFLQRSVRVRGLLPGLQCLRRNASGEPSHPLYLSRGLRPQSLAGD